MPKSLIVIFFTSFIFSHSANASVRSIEGASSHYKTSLFSRKPSPLALSVGLAFREWDSQLTGYDDNGESLYGINLKLDYEFTNHISIFTKYTSFQKDADHSAPYSSIDRPTKIGRKDLSTAITYAP
jgi:hypothetical protein